MRRTVLGAAMARLDRWSPRGHPPLSRSILDIPKTDATVKVAALPPSKSHLIRWLLLAAQGDDEVRLQGAEGAGEDAVAMREALESMGVRITTDGSDWCVHGVGAQGFKRPISVLNCRNSGTALNLLTVAVTRIGTPVMLDGDATLRRRGDPAFWAALGVEISHGTAEETLPLLIRGPLEADAVQLDLSRTSQQHSALLLSMPARQTPLRIEGGGEPVSRRHLMLSFDLAARCGSPNEIGDLNLVPWRCSPPSTVEIPRDASHLAFWRLYALLHGPIEVPKPDPEDALGAELLFGLDLADRHEIDLRDANDLITPLAAAMAVGGGGRILGAAHAQHKESARITRTVELLADFGLEASATGSGLEIEGEQPPRAPSEVVATHGDHRLQMTAVVLATAVGARVEGADLHRVSYPTFLDQIQP